MLRFGDVVRSLMVASVHGMTDALGRIRSRRRGVPFET
jgi:hypothetical protein